MEPDRRNLLEQNDAAEERQGFALAGALLALVIVGALLTGSFYAASQEQATGLSAKYNDEALYVAETALNEVVGATPIDTLRHLAAGQTKLLANRVISVGGQPLGGARVWVRRVAAAGDQYLFVSKAAATRGGKAGGGERVLGLFTQLLPIEFPKDRAMQLYAGVTVRGSSIVNGQDMYPTGSVFSGTWTDCSTTGSQAAIVAKDASAVSTSGGGTITNGSTTVPAVQGDPSMDADDFFQFGAVDYDFLASLATVVMAAGANPKPEPSLNADGVTCNKQNPVNWGEPGTTDGGATIVDACRSYWPIVHALGNLNLNAGGRGQGVLLVDGDLNIQGGFEFWGVTIVKGAIRTTGTGGHLYGTVMAYSGGDINMDDTMAGNSLVNFSSCAIEKAAQNVNGFNFAMPVKAHAWIDLTATNAGF